MSLVHKVTYRAQMHVSLDTTQSLVLFDTTQTHVLYALPISSKYLAKNLTTSQEFRSCKQVDAKNSTQNMAILQLFQAHPGRAHVIQDVITRVQDLDKAGQISGVMDDRGKVSNSAAVGSCCCCSYQTTILFTEVSHVAPKYNGWRPRT